MVGLRAAAVVAPLDDAFDAAADAAALTLLTRSARRDEWSEGSKGSH